MTATAVLVHGAWHGGWCFERVVRLLETRGVESVSLDLPGHGADPGPFTDLAGDAARVSATLDHLSGPVVLLGHSYGGAVITAAGGHPLVRHLVYLAAFAIDADESCRGAATGAPGAELISHDGRPDLGAALTFHDDGTTTIDPREVHECLYNDCDDATVAWAVERLGPQPMGNLGESPARIAWRERPSTYVVCARDNMVHPDLQRILARRCTNAVEWDASHSPFASQPALVADLVAELAIAE